MIIITGAPQQPQALALRADRVYRTGVTVAPMMDPAGGIASTALRFTGGLGRARRRSLRGVGISGFFATLVAKVKGWRARATAMQFINPPAGAMVASNAASPQVPATTGATATTLNGQALQTYGVGPAPMAAQMLAPEAISQINQLAQMASAQQGPMVGGASYADVMAYRNGLLWRRP